jgi:hypothetical protein
VKTRHVWLLPALEVGPPKQGYVLTWRRVVRLASPPSWEAYVLYVDERREDARIEWVPAAYLRPVESERP